VLHKCGKGYDSDQEKIGEKLKGKQFLLVLDDMWKWHEVEWEKLLAQLEKVEEETIVRSYIVTTRLLDAAEMIKTVDCPILLDRLGGRDLENYLMHVFLVNKNCGQLIRS
jgi:hypothetical protein